LIIFNKTKFLSKYKMDSIFFRYLRIIIGITLSAFLGIIILSSRYYLHSGRQELLSVNMQALTRSKESFSAIMTELSGCANYTHSDSVVQNFLNSPTGAQYNRSDALLISDIKRMLNSFILANDYIDSVYIYSYKNNHVLTTLQLINLDKFNDSSVIRNHLNEKNVLLLPRQVIDNAAVIPSNILTFIKPFPGDSMILINLDMDKLGAAIDITQSETNNNLVVANRDNNIIYATKKSLYMKTLKETGLYNYSKNPPNTSVKINNISTIVSVLNLDNFGIQFLSLMQDVNYQNNIRFTILMLTLALLISILLSAVISYIIAAKLFKPIENVLQVIDNPEQWLNMNPSSQSNFDELKYITQNILKSFTTHQQMEEKLAQRLILLKNAQSLALYSQITPHFLFNTLQTINLLSIEAFHGDNNISDTINLLGDMLRISLKEGESIIPLETEIRHAMCYEQIQKKRYGDLFIIVWDIHEGLMDYLVPKVIIQPLIENSIYHGIKNNNAKGTIWVNIVKNSDNLTITVSDNGVGLPPARINELNQSLSSDYTSPVDHIGLQNVNQRIKITYGEEYGVIVRAHESGGLYVKIIIPLTLQ